MLCSPHPALQDDDKVWINQVKEEAMQRRGKPQKPLPYSARVENLNNTEEVSKFKTA